MGTGAVPLADLAASAGAGQAITDYLEARGIRTTPTLALIAQDRDTFISQIVRPLLDGYQKGTVRIVLDEDEKPIAQAVMEHMWREAQIQWERRRATAPVASGIPAAVPGTTSPSQSAGSVPATEKIPKQLPPQVWQKQIARYNGISVDGRPRKFPEKEVLGAEQVLGRIWHEHTVSKAYTPVHLGEILQKRSFTASGEVNPLQKQTKSTQLLRVQDDQIIQDEDNRVWTPRSILALLDGVNSVRWAWVLLQLGEEDHVHTFSDWFIQKIRARPNKLENIRIFWESAGWRIAMGMRAGQTFGEISAEVMADVDLLNEAMSKEIPKETKPAASKKRPASDEGGPAAQRPRNNYNHWGNYNNSKGSKGNQKGRQNYNSYTGAQKWKTGSWGGSYNQEAASTHDQNQGR